MTNHKFTDEEVIRALEVCAVNTVSREGVFTYRGIPLRFLCADALDLINRQMAEIERLQAALDCYEETSGNKQARAKAIKEFADELRRVLCLEYRGRFSLDDELAEYKVQNAIEWLVERMTQGASTYGR